MTIGANCEMIARRLGYMTPERKSRWPLLVLISSFFSFGLLAQAPQSNSYHDPSLNVVKAQALQHPSSYAFLKELSDGIGPRLTGSVEDSRAAEWALQTMHAIGLQYVHAEPWHLEHGWKRGFACAQLLSPFPLELTVTSYGWAGSTPTGGVEAEVIEVNSNALSDEVGRSAARWAGKVLLLVPKDPKQGDMLGTISQMPEFLSAARKAGAVAVLDRDPRPGMMLVHTGPLGFPGRSSILPVLDIAVEHEALIRRILEDGKPVRLKVEVQNGFTPGAVVSNNIVGEIPGTQQPEQIVILGAHLDSWDLGTGAIDDGFGVAAVLGAAKSIVASGVKPHRTIRIVLFTGEEQGLLGSRAYVQEHQAEADSVLCALVLDWGNGPITKYLFSGHDEFATPLQDLINSVADVAAVRTGNGYLTYTDAYAFILAGIPGITPFQDSPNYTLIGHSAADTLDKVEADILERDSALLALSSLWIADYPTTIGRHWSPEKTAQMLSEQRTALRALGLWPFSQ
jgi:carboxypeptidase Q